MKIWYSSYQLYPKGLLNSQIKTRMRKGALLRVRFEDGALGYADICPFSEMGDRPLELELKQIAMSTPSNVGSRSLAYARIDAVARKNAENLYDRNVKIKNHFLITDILRFNLDRAEKIEMAGYSEFKIKMGRDLFLESEQIEKLSNRLSERSRLRLDFNGSLTRDHFMDWFEKNQKWLKPSLDFIEDPFAYDAREWSEISRKYEITFAVDRAADPLVSEMAGAEVIVVKPAVQDSDRIVEKFMGSEKKFVFTHYMDFPLGQMCALYSAQRAAQKAGAQMLTCGLQHHDIYEGITAQDAIQTDGPFILPPEGYGFGFDGFLEKQSWVELK